MTTIFNIWKKFARSKRYRDQFVASNLKRGLPFQIRTLRKQRGWSQAELAEYAGVTQGVVSRAEDPDYGNLTFNTVLKIAAGFDVAFVGLFVPFSDLAKRFGSQSEETLTAPSFDNDFPDGMGFPEAVARVAMGVGRAEVVMVDATSVLTIFNDETDTSSVAAPNALGLSGGSGCIFKDDADVAPITVNASTIH